MKGMSPGEIRDSCLKGEIEAKTALAVLGVMLERVFEQYKDYEHYRKERIVEPDKIFTDYDKKIFEGQRKVNQIMQEGVDIDQYMTQIETAFPQNKPEEAPAKTKEGLETIEISIKGLGSYKEAERVRGDIIRVIEAFTEPIPAVVGEGQTTPHIPEYVMTMIDKGIIEVPREEEYKGKYRILVTLKEFIVYLQDNNIPLNTDVICRDYIQKDNAPVSRNTLKKYKYRDYN